ncbi:MAG: hypothetical protein KC592_03260 [Nitrospira sp.]|nr:hypothetical protein [Nitrospira sp.]HBP90786.1 hypothetical protein [Nitrospiraceae bacterium]HNP30579.1 hypothetical protein [Nitrospirales bacterium]
MDCPRCQGTMIVDDFVDLATSGEFWMPGWRCLMCGEVIDPLIEHHRQLQREHQELVGAISGSTARPPSPISLRSRKARKRSF